MRLLTSREISTVGGKSLAVDMLGSEVGAHVPHDLFHTLRAVHDRDLNAARDIVALGRRETLNACGGGVRPGAILAVAGETGTHRGATRSGTG